MSNVTIRTALSGHKRFISPSPVGIGKIYTEMILEDGTMGIVQTGKHDLNEFVQASKESCLVYNILDRFQKTGDPSILNVNKGFYADVTEMPKDLRQAHNLILTLESKFSELDGKTKEKFDNNYLKFVDSVLNGTVTDVLGVKTDSIKTDDLILEDVIDEQK